MEHLWSSLAEQLYEMELGGRGWKTAASTMSRWAAGHLVMMI